MNNLISFNLTEGEKKRIEGAMSTLINTFTPHLITITTKDKQKLAKISDRSKPFVEKSIHHAKNAPDLVMKPISVEEMQIDYNAYNLLSLYLVPLQKLVKSIDDSLTQAGSEALQASLYFYRTAQNSANMGVYGSKIIVDDLGKRFERRNPQEGEQDQDEQGDM